MNRGANIALLHEGAIQHAKTHPDQTAFKYRDLALTYSELDRTSNGLSDTLAQHNAKLGDRVGICSPTSQFLPIAVAGIHKAGCAFVPIDHMAPLSRILKIIELAAIKFMIIGLEGQALAEQILEHVPDMRLIVGCEGSLPQCIAWHDIPQRTDRRNVTSIQPDDLAYIIFTSGSTGEPKGVAHTHASGHAYVQRASQTYDVNSKDVIANFAPLYFDISTFAYFCGPAVGATMVLVPDEFALFPTNIATLVEAERITIWYSAPLVLQQLLTHSDFRERDLSCLRWVKFGGEVMPVKYLAQLMQALPNARFSNVYGPAEVNQCTFYHLPAPPDVDQTVPIGNTWDSTDALILDSQDQPVEHQVGQLAISSPTMMLGYWGNADLTKRALYKSLDSDGNERVYYKTGDLVEYNEAGQLVFIGRSDRQVKVRGFRVELDDVEFHAMNMDSIIECAALLDDRDDAKSHIVLIAQCVAGTTASQVNRYLASHLPRYACPHIVELLAHPLPRNTSGKIDRLALLRSL